MQYTLPTYKFLGRRPLIVVVMSFCLICGSGVLRAQDPAPAPTISIVIEGDVYGGGRNGAVGTSKTTATESTPQSEVRLNSGALDAPTTTVSIYQGQIRTVFGGGENGRTYGGTNVLVGQSEVDDCPVEIGGTIGGTNWTGTIHGGLFGAGDGAAAYVFGHSLVTIQAGTLYQNIYGGGNQADLMGTTSVVLQGGDFRGEVYGGARMADIFGFSFVDIDGEDAKTNLVVNTVYGGNDISGNITSSSNWPWTATTALTLPTALSHAGDYSITTGYNAFLHSSVEATGKHIFVGQLFGGGNGDYAYSGAGPYSYTMPTGLADDPATDGVNESVKTFTNLNKPEVSRTYLELKGGTFGYVYGGGNAANVTTSVDICIDNNSSVISSTVLEGIMKTGEPASFKNATRLTDMGINWTTFTDEYQFVRVFGGNNKAAMNIRPTWHLLRGSINNLYSGGNEGSMTSPTGLILSLTSPNMTVNNVFGGCRKADVDPRGDKGAGFDMPQETFEGETMEAGFAARVIVKAGTINNVYGGNDISGNVYYGANVHILSNINGDVYGGGNGSYAYTDNAQLASDLLYGDFYYDPSTAASSVEALNLFRPNTESVSLSVKGTSDANPTTIGGSIYCGGNSTSLRNDNAGEATAKLKIGSYVVADRVFLGNNGIDMVDVSAGGVLAKYAGTVEDVGGTTRDFSTLDLTNAATFATYMDGVAMSILPEVDFASDYVAYSTKFGSFFCGGNVGSMTYAGVNDIAFNDKVIIFESLVGGCNNADVPAHAGLNAAYKGGILGSAAERASYVDGSGNIKDRLHLTLNGLHLQPMRWKKDGNGDYVLDDNDNRQLEWNTFDSRTGLAVTPPTELPAANAQGNNISTEDDIYRRLVGGNVYGGCYTSGHVNGNVVINLDATLTDRNIIFDAVDEDSLGVKLYDNDHYLIKTRRSGVLLNEQGMDALGTSLNVFGGGYGAATQIWGSTTINLNKGYTFQIFGGAEQGIIGKLEDGDPAVYNPQYSTYINMDGELPGVARLAKGDSSDIAEAEFIYGGGFEGLILGNTQINLGNGRIFNSFAGSCNADILGHTETYVGRGSSDDANLGFPWVRDHIYGGNDLGGRIRGSEDFSGRVSATALAMVYNPTNAASPAVLEASAYTEYMQGRVENIFGGCYGDYDYAGDEHYRDYVNADGSYVTGFTKPRLDNAFINFKPATTNSNNSVARLFGAGQGASGEIGKDSLQTRSYILVDIASSTTNFRNMEVFGAGDYSGLGMGVAPATALANTDSITAAAVIDLARGQIGSVYGGSHNEGVTRRTVVNVPTGSTIKFYNIFGGAYGLTNEVPCDVYESRVNYYSSSALASGGVYGGNNNARRTLYTRVDIAATVWNNLDNGYTGYVYGGGYGENTWVQYTEVNINNGGYVYKVYGGGSAGKVLNGVSIAAWKAQIEADVEAWEAGGSIPAEKPDLMALDLTLGAGYAEDNGSGNSLPNAVTGYRNEFMNTTLARGSKLAEDIIGGRIHDRDGFVRKYNTNVHINKGGYVDGYCYGGGYGEKAIVSGYTYIDVLGGTVNRDVYAAGESGAVTRLYVPSSIPMGNPNTFVPATNAYLRGGMVRNIYGGGWRGDVGYHDVSTNSTATDIDGYTNVVIGHMAATSYYNGIPAVMRNAYGGGEGGSVYGSTCVNMNNGYVGFRFTGADGDHSQASDYREELEDSGYPTPNTFLDDAGNLFGGGYVANSYVDTTFVNMWGGVVRSSMYGGGEIGPIGRGTLRADAPTEGAFVNGDAKIYKGGLAKVLMQNGHVRKDVFGGGRGFDNWGGDGTKFYTAEQVAAMDLGIKGFVFGQTDVHIYGGEIGTSTNVAANAGGYGNVFGGGNIGHVYSSVGKKVGSNPDDISDTTGLPEDGGGFYYTDGDKTKAMTADCNVEVAPHCLVTAAGGITIDGDHYDQYTYVPIEKLNLLGNRYDTQWNSLDISGVTIHNAVFAGGNVSAGSDLMYVNTVTVFGNAVAALRDVYNRDLISIGAEHIGGLYGDGNLTFVDGYRELHIDNYGTDYYGLDETISKEEYNALSDRERAYFSLNYQCIKGFDYDGKNYSVGNKMTLDEFAEVFKDEPYYVANHEPNPEYWVELGFCSIYAGRLMNTVQRADMVGVFGSRMVMQGALDRVPEKVDYTNYTINRVGEVSLNKRYDPSDASKVHDNYFGMYNIVNYLGNLTSDVFFSDTRVTDSTNPENQPTEGSPETYYDWKLAKAGRNNRNNATSNNLVALASGVYLELINESSEKSGTTDWGYITGVVQLDLIDVMQGLGGGYVYAKNEHGAKTYHEDWGQVLLSPYNIALNARTYRRFTYDENDLAVVETSGNFVHNAKQIVDDCYPAQNAYEGDDASPAHYWYVKGSVYVYNQIISAYTGAPNSYPESISIPVTITAASNGRLQLRDVRPNLYAYYDQYGEPLGRTGGEDVFIANNITYRAGDPIDYWSYQQLSVTEQAKFVPMVYVTIAECQIGDDTYPKGYVLLPAEYASLKAAHSTVYHTQQERDVDFDFVFRPTNNLGHDTGYTLEFGMNNPSAWDKYYTLTSNSSPTISAADYAALSEANKALYTAGPTYRPTASAVYGQRSYDVGEIITSDVVDAYPSAYVGGRTDQATVERAYVVTRELTTLDKDGNTQHLYPGTPVVASSYTSAQWTALADKVSLAKVSTNTLQLTETEYVYAGNLLSTAEVTALADRYAELNTEATPEQIAALLTEYLSDAYYCTEAGLYGGDYYEVGKAYTALNSWNTMSATDRASFLYNYDALDLLVDPTYGGSYGYKQQYDGYTPGGGTSAQYAGCTPLDPKLYSVAQPIDYNAQFNGAENLEYRDESNTLVTITPNQLLTRLQYEDIPNERMHYSPIAVTSPGDYYIVREPFIVKDVPYTTGQVLTSDTYSTLSDLQKANVYTFTADAAHAGTLQGEVYSTVTYYFCRDDYYVNEKGMGQSVTDINNNTYTSGNQVPKLTMISEASYNNLVNLQNHFVIKGIAPRGSTTLYVSRESDIYDLSTEKIITVIFSYDYQESDESGHNVTPISERHIINIHIQFKSGVPEIGQLSAPAIVLPGSTVGMKVPSVSPGAFEITSSGWEMYANQHDAESHLNGQPYYNTTTPMYWYQNGYYVAYYAQTYLGKTYSNPVQFSVANYHDLAKVMGDTNHHYYIDHEDVDRASKIYVNNASTGLDQLSDLIDLSFIEKTYDQDEQPEAVASGPLAGHVPFEDRVRGGANLEFILRTNLDHSSETWSPIADGDGECFSGTLHGEGYTISGLDHSLIGHLCGNVYNLGVKGSFTGAGVADEGDGYVENCWISTTGTPANGVYAVLGNPTRSGETDLVQVVNSYYPETDTYAVPADDTHGKATAKSEQAFYNGEVAYDLNGFYLNKRYYDNVDRNSLDANGYEYSYFYTNSEGNLAVGTGYYESDYSHYLSPRTLYSGSQPVPQYFGYVEHRYADGDFVYAGGSIPEDPDVRQYIDEQTNEFYPIWPDDYVYFGQMLNYGYDEEYAEQVDPSRINKSGGRLRQTGSNRVYRAPAYFRSKTMGEAYFNPKAYFAAISNDEQNEPYPDMTAIDFTGYNDVANGYHQGEDANGHFFAPLLDDNGLRGFKSVDLTRNLLVYVPAATAVLTDAVTMTNTVLSEALNEPAYSETNATYRTVARADTVNFQGHAVYQNGGAYVATNDHLLIDKQDFNAPIQYDFASGKRMWYQRTPDNYVDMTKGWEGISLPFDAELVTTQTKGEITHFYSGSRSADATSGSKWGHEYWLREYNGGSVSTEDANLFLAGFEYPAAGNKGDKEYTNTFLFDYYYQNNSSARQDANTDLYQQQYYATAHTHENYGYSAAATPYIVGFPGTTYYEFDLSGNFTVAHPRQSVALVPRQLITFASEPGARIRVSDDELASVTENGYSFVPSYMKQTLPAGDAYVISNDGSSYELTAAATEVEPFRPYFMLAPSPAPVQPAPARPVQTIYIGGMNESRPQAALPGEGSLNIYGSRLTIWVDNTMKTAQTVVVTNVAGIQVARVQVAPGTKAAIPVDVEGVYIVNRHKIGVTR